MRHKPRSGIWVSPRGSDLLLTRRGTRIFLRCGRRLSPGSGMRVSPRSGISPGIYAGVCGPLTVVASPVHGASRRDRFSVQRSPLRIPIVELLDSFQSIKRRPFGMMFSLVSDVRFHPVQIFRAKTNDAVPDLPLQNFLQLASLLVDVVRRAALQLPNPITDRECRRNRHRQMDMGFDSPDLMHKRARCVDNAFSQGSVSKRFDARRQERRAVLSMPNKVEVDFGVIVARHCKCPHRCRDSSSMSSEKARKRASVWAYYEANSPRRERRGYYRCAGNHAGLMSICHGIRARMSIRPGIHAGVRMASNLPSSPVYGASRHSKFPLAIH